MKLAEQLIKTTSDQLLTLFDRGFYHNAWLTALKKDLADSKPLDESQFWPTDPNVAV